MNTGVFRATRAAYFVLAAQLTEDQLNEEVARVLTANDPNVPNNITKYNYKERAYKVIAVKHRRACRSTELLW